MRVFPQKSTQPHHTNANKNARVRATHIRRTEKIYNGMYTHTHMLTHLHTKTRYPERPDGVRSARMALAMPRCVQHSANTFIHPHIVDTHSARARALGACSLYAPRTIDRTDTQADRARIIIKKNAFRTKSNIARYVEHINARAMMM